MFLRTVLGPSVCLRAFRRPPAGGTLLLRRSLHVDGRERLSNFWTPTSIRGSGGDERESSSSDSNALLVRAGYLRQAHSGVFHLLPLGLRVQDKLERLIDKHMRSLGASKVSLSSLTSEALWRESGRFQGDNAELLRVKDRRDSGFLLSPTHEEEITALVASAVSSYKDVPVRLYQISRKYRDERRPRQGLLRAKEFLMKDLYTFDYTTEAALATYEDTRKAYAALFDELKLPYLVAEADSGSIGGDLSHEYHFISPKGEDNVIACDSCDYVANEELAQKRLARDPPVEDIEANPLVWTGISRDRSTLYEVYLPRPTPAATEERSKQTTADLINLHAVKALVPDLDATIESGAREIWSSSSSPSKSITRLFDHRVAPSAAPSSPSDSQPSARPIAITNLSTHPVTSLPLDLTRIFPADPCPRCESGKLTIHPAIEIGHTFHLGTRYSAPLHAQVASHDPASPAVTLTMGCHGIGVSRLIAAVASVLADRHGLAWPRVIAPWEVVLIPGAAAPAGDAEAVLDELAAANLEAVLDDRDKAMGWKLKDADLIGYPVVAILGRGWKDGKVEVQCRRLQFKQDVDKDRVREVVAGLLERL